MKRVVFLLALLPSIAFADFQRLVPILAERYVDVRDLPLLIRPGAFISAPLGQACSASRCIVVDPPARTASAVVVAAPLVPSGAVPSIVAVPSPSAPLRPR